MNGPTAVVYPLPSIIADRLFAGRDVFVKYTPRESVRFGPGTRLLIYSSTPVKAIVGEAVIDKLEFLTPEQALTKYGQRIMLDAQELSDYATMRPRPSGKKLLVLTLTHVRRLKMVLRPPRTVTMNGLTISRQECRNLLRGVRYA